MMEVKLTLDRLNVLEMYYTSGLNVTKHAKLRHDKPYAPPANDNNLSSPVTTTFSSTDIPYGHT